MLAKIYWTLWAFIAALALLILVSGNFSMITAVAFGFVIFGMIFMGMIAVLPVTVTHPSPAKAPNVKPEKVKQAAVTKEGIIHPKPLAMR